MLKLLNKSASTMPVTSVFPGRSGALISVSGNGAACRNYSTDGNAWDYFSHDQSRLRTYRWGEDGLAGLSDDKQRSPEKTTVFLRPFSCTVN